MFSHRHWLNFCTFVFNMFCHAFLFPLHIVFSQFSILTVFYPYNLLIWFIIALNLKHCWLRITNIFCMHHVVFPFWKSLIILPIISIDNTLVRAMFTVFTHLPTVAGYNIRLFLMWNAHMHTYRPKTKSAELHWLWYVPILPH